MPCDVPGFASINKAGVLSIVEIFIVFVCNQGGIAFLNHAKVIDREVPGKTWAG
jgi:hypothetical protein